MFFNAANDELFSALLASAIKQNSQEDIALILHSDRICSSSIFTENYHQNPIAKSLENLEKIKINGDESMESLIIDLYEKLRSIYKEECAKNTNQPYIHQCEENIFNQFLHFSIENDIPDLFHKIKKDTPRLFDSHPIGENEKSETEIAIDPNGLAWLKNSKKIISTITPQELASSISDLDEPEEGGMHLFFLNPAVMLGGAMSNERMDSLLKAIMHSIENNTNEANILMNHDDGYSEFHTMVSNDSMAVKSFLNTIKNNKDFALQFQDICTELLAEFKSPLLFKLELSDDKIKNAISKKEFNSGNFILGVGEIINQNKDEYYQEMISRNLGPAITASSSGTYLFLANKKQLNTMMWCFDNGYDDKPQPGEKNWRETTVNPEIVTNFDAYVTAQAAKDALKDIMGMRPKP